MSEHTVEWEVLDKRGRVIHRRKKGFLSIFNAEAYEFELQDRKKEFKDIGKIIVTHMTLGKRYKSNERFRKART